MLELESRTLLTTFTVTNTLVDGSTGSLPWAINQVDADTGTSVDTIDFDIAGTGPFTIAPTSALPTITHPVLIDGYSQPGASENTETTSDNAVLMIDLGSGSQSFDGLDIAASNTTVQGLAINGFNNGIQLESGSTGDLIQGNFIGTDVTGTYEQGNYQGILVNDTSGDTIGGTTPSARNVVSGNSNQDIFLAYGASDDLVEGNFVGLTASGTSTLYTYGNGVISYFSNDNTVAGNVIGGLAIDGIQFTGSSGCLAEGNLVGTDPTGTIALPNATGVSVQYGGSTGDTIGGTTPGSGNLISGNDGPGILVPYGASYNAIEGNLIGTDISGLNPLPNTGPGVEIVYSSSYNTVGGTGAGAGNTIAFNDGAGVIVGSYSGDSTVGNAILSNSIDGNGALGIDLGDDGVTPNTPGGPHVGANDLQNYPVLSQAATYAGNTYVIGSLNSAPATTFTLQFFASPTADPSGFGQGQTLIGTTTVTTDANGNASFVATFPGAIASGQAVSATATDPNGNTSEFAQDVTSTAATSPLVAVDDTYNVDENNTLTVAAPGVLANDYDLTGGTLTAVLNTTTADGTLSFQSDGAFTYTPDAGFVGTDSFTYHDTDGTYQSNVATVTINVNPKTYVVTNTNDSGPGSLRQAMIGANLATSAPPDTIEFDIPGTGPFVIAPLTPLPALTHPTIIDGYTQPGAQANTLATGDNAVIEIELSGTNVRSSDGILISGGGSTVEGLSIVGFNNGIHVNSTVGGDVISGDFIGVTPGGSAGPNYNDGVFIDGEPSVTVGGTTPAARDVVSSNYGNGVDASNATGVVVQGSYIGTDPTGTIAMGNATGLGFVGSPSATIGGPAAGAGNVISANNGEGIQLNDSVDALVQDNLIGTDATGTVAMGNEFFGLEDGPNDEFTATDDTILGNVISANGSYYDDAGIGFYTATNNLIQGNFIGTDITGTKPLGNTGDGIYMGDSGENTIGGTTLGAGNVISANGQDGILIGTEIFGDNLIEGNFIGTDLTGTKPLGNDNDGLVLADAGGDTVGGTTAAAANVISANGGDGINIDDYPTNVSVIEGNFIGTDAGGASDLGNSGHGVYVQTSNNTIGGTAAGAGNVIAYNGKAGVAVVDNYNGTTTAVSILSNSIYANQGLGIDLNDDGVTPNHVGGPITGPNNYQNYPVLLAAVTYDGQTYIKGTLNSADDTSYTIQFFSDPTADPSGYGQGETYLGQAAVTTNSSGNASFQVSFSTVVPAGYVISATATDPTGDTSEFAQDVPVVAATTSIVAVNDQYHIDLNTTLTVAAPGVQANDLAINGQPFSSVLVTGPSDGKVTLNANGSFTYTPKKNFVGTDTFTYEDVQGSTVSNVATVTIQVNPKVYVVTNTNDSGPGSLRQAMIGANLATSAPPDTIEFDIPGTGPFVIAPLTPLPALTHATIIDGYTQPGARPNSMVVGDNAVIEIQLSGQNIPNADGLLISGGGSTVEGLSITGFNNGIHVNSTVGGDVISGDFIGVTPGGGAGPNGNDGVFIDGAPSVTVGGTTPAARDVISANGGVGVYAQGATGVVVQGSYLGTDPTGTHAMGTYTDVSLYESPSATIGGAGTGAGNVISASYEYGIQLDDSVDALVQGNLIGTDATGTKPLGNAWAGLDIGPNPEFTATDDSILDNVISANGTGIVTYTATNNLIQGNRIGTDLTGTKPLGNTGSGILMSDSGEDTIGGTTRGQGNVISANGGSGIATDTEIFGDNLIEGNRIGTDITGTIAMGNGGDGIDLFDAGSNTVGGTTAGAANIISANGGTGILTGDYLASDNVIEGNFIGTDAAGKDLGNHDAGVFVQDSNNTVGGTARGAGNVIAYNGGAGVAVVDNYNGPTVGVSILSNSIYANTGLGIDLGDDGVTPNHPGGPVYGPNNLQNYPVLTSATAAGTRVTIAGTLNSAADTSYLIQFFSDPKADPSGHGQGETYLGSIMVTTDANGNASFTATFTAPALAGHVVSATATDPTGDTSEFSEDVTVTLARPVAGPSVAASPSVAIAPTSDGQASPVSDDVLDELATELAMLQQQAGTAAGGKTSSPS